MGLIRLVRLVLVSIFLSVITIQRVCVCSVGMRKQQRKGKGRTRRTANFHSINLPNSDVVRPRSFPGVETDGRSSVRNHASSWTRFEEDLGDATALVCNELG